MPKGNYRREAGKHGAPTPSSRNATPSPCGIRGRLKPIVERYVGDDVIDEMRRSLGLPAVRRSPRHWRLSAHCTALKNALIWKDLSMAIQGSMKVFRVFDSTS